MLSIHVCVFILFMCFLEKLSFLAGPINREQASSLLTKKK